MKGHLVTPDMVVPPLIRSATISTLYHERSFDRIRLGESLVFFDAAIGATAPDGHIYLEPETNLTAPRSLAKGLVFSLESIDLEGVPAVVTNRIIVSLIIGQQHVERGPLDILRRSRCERMIDGLRTIELRVECYDTSWVQSPQVLRAELWGRMLRPVL